ncbi:MAG TPA: hypothetical protein VG944_11790 [Fimbriimonas sp.]|nr:hypothetical protein [Fimbriimonas sp.]
MKQIAFVGLCGLALIGCGSQSETPAPAPTPVAKNDKAPDAKSGEASRRTVKTATDPDASKIDKAAKETTIEDIAAQKPPAGQLEGRSGPFETTTWKVKAHLESIKLMKDDDYYLVLKGEKGGQTVVEVPNPDLCKGSPLQPEIAAARKALEERYHPTKDLKHLNDDATVTGVGFLGWNRSKKGATGKTGARLMPGTGFEFNSK